MIPFSTYSKTKLWKIPKKPSLRCDNPDSALVNSLHKGGLSPDQVHPELQSSIQPNWELATFWSKISAQNSYTQKHQVLVFLHTHRVKLPNNKCFRQCPCICRVANIFKVLSSISPSLLPEDFFSTRVLQVLISVNSLLKTIPYSKYGISFIYFWK